MNISDLAQQYRIRHYQQIQNDITQVGSLLQWHLNALQQLALHTDAQLIYEETECPYCDVVHLPPDQLGMAIETMPDAACFHYLCSLKDMVLCPIHRPIEAEYAYLEHPDFAQLCAQLSADRVFIDRAHDFARIMFGAADVVAE
jgi:hypothetical protein